MEVHVKYKTKNKEEMCKALNDIHVEITVQQNDTKLTQHACNLKNSYDEITQTDSVNVVALRKSINKDEQEYQNKIEL